MPLPPRDVKLYAIFGGLVAGAPSVRDRLVGAVNVQVSRTYFFREHVVVDHALLQRL